MDHANAAEEEEPTQKKERNDNSDDEYSLISSLTSMVTHGNDTWLVDSGVSKHMTGYKDYLSTLIKRVSHQEVKLGDDYQYPIKCVGEDSYKLETGKLLKMKDVLYVLSLKKNHLSILGLEKKGFRVAFMDGQVLMWPRKKTIDDAIMIGVEERGLYKLKGKSYQALVHSTINPCELWHRKFSHLHYKAIVTMSKAVIGILELQANREGVCKGCAQGKNVKRPFPSSANKEKGILDIIHSYVCRPMTTTSLSRYVYYVSFIDDYSCKTWIFFLKGKMKYSTSSKNSRLLQKTFSKRR